ncbi:hypothetical protein DL764_001743 [Monosporascus ibericus]|uniref:HIT domain-containing protein n=1 Tax=Monosporascus ibericus TaxID=155417 RepID=A0A4Q4TTB5_9PEZI|nr:hypothetical protein DL764_001743 [Monosporascus ibericus]
MADDQSTQTPAKLNNATSTTLEPFDAWKPITSDKYCPFCQVATEYAPFPPEKPPAPTSDHPRPSKLSPRTYVVLSTPAVMAFLGASTLAGGHLLLCTRAHRPQMDAVDAHEAAELGRWLRVLSAAVARTTGLLAWNIVQSNGAEAAQTAFHTHFHVIPKPKGASASASPGSNFGRGYRLGLDHLTAPTLAQNLRRNIAKMVAEMGA